MEFATKVKLAHAFREAADALLGTLWVNHGDNLPAFNIDEIATSNHFRLEVKRPASVNECDAKMMMFSFIRNGIIEMTVYYDLTKASSKKAVQLVDAGVQHKHTYSEAGNMLMAYYNQVMYA